MKLEEVKQRVYLFEQMRQRCDHWLDDELRNCEEPTWRTHLYTLANIGLINNDYFQIEVIGDMVKSDHTYAPIVRLNALLLELEIEFPEFFKRLRSNFITGTCRYNNVTKREVKRLLRFYPALVLVPFFKFRKVPPKAPNPPPAY